MNRVQPTFLPWDYFYLLHSVVHLPQRMMCKCWNALFVYVNLRLCVTQFCDVWDCEECVTGHTVCRDAILGTRGFMLMCLAVVDCGSRGTLVNYVLFLKFSVHVCVWRRLSIHRFKIPILLCPVCCCTRVVLSLLWWPQCSTTFTLWTFE